MSWDSDLLTSGLQFLIVAAILYAATRLFLNRDRLNLSVNGYSFGLFLGALAGVGLLHLTNLFVIYILPALRPLPVSAGSFESFMSNHHDAIALLGTGIIAVGVIAASWSVRTLMVTVDDRDRLFRAVFDNAPISMSLKDRDGRFLLVNKPQEFWLGHSSAEIIGRTLGTNLSDTALVKTLTDAEQTVLRTGQVKNVEVRLEKSDDQIFDLIVTKFPIRSPDGSIESTGTFAVDITERRRAELALERSEARFRDFAESSADWFWEMDGDLRFTYMSPNVELVVGVPPEWHYGKTREDLLGPDYDRDAWDGHLQTLRAHLPFRDFIYRRVGGGIEAKWLRVSGKPVLGGDDKFLGYRGTASDITGRKKAEEAQRRSERRLAEIFDASPAMIIVSDYATGRFLEVNAAALSTLGYTLDEMLGKTSLGLGVWKEKQQRDKLISLLDRDNFVRNYELEYYTKDGKVIPLLFSGAKIESEGDFQILGVMTNIAEWKALEDQLRQSQKMEAVGQLTGGLAHDLNNLLGVIIGNLDFLGEALHDDTELCGYVETATKAAVGGAELNKRLLAFSRTQPLAPKVLDLNAQVSSMLAVLRRTLGETITVETIQNDILWSCDVDPAQVETALLNLAINARDAMPGGGTLTIETANVRLDDDYAATQAEVTPGAYVRLTVTDTGRGMAPEVVEHVFEPFFTTKGVGEGSGLGLSMVFGFAKQSGGHVTVQSEEGAGTAVTLYLPRSLRQASADDAPVELPSASSGTVLVVEDDPDLRSLAETMLLSLGYTVLVAKDGRSALTAIDRAQRVDLLLTDVVLPGGMNGPAIAEAAIRRRKDIKVLYMSGYTQDAVTEQGRIGNDYQLLQKPFRKAELAKKVEAALTGVS